MKRTVNGLRAPDVLLTGLRSSNVLLKAPITDRLRVARKLAVGRYKNVHDSGYTRFPFD